MRNIENNTENERNSRCKVNTACRKNYPDTVMPTARAVLSMIY